MKERISGFTLYSSVLPGAKLDYITRKAESLIPSPRRTIGTTHVYIMGGIPDITQKISNYHHKSGKYTECIYTEPIQDTITRLTHAIDNTDSRIRQSGAVPCFCTITSCDIQKYNSHLLAQGKTYTLDHKENYPVMQTNLENALEAINKHIYTVNLKNKMSTPFCHTAIRKRQGKKPRYYYKHVYNLLRDGVHGTDATKDKWAEAIEGAIRNNRGHKRKAPDTDEENKSPKRSWRGERKTNS